MKRSAWLRLVMVSGLIALFCAFILPGLSRTRFLAVVRNNLSEDIDATAYFYTEIDGFNRFEQGVKSQRQTTETTELRRKEKVHRKGAKSAKL